eukprot:4029914-Heterocapsa_arctica.AAC.1
MKVRVQPTSALPKTLAEMIVKRGVGLQRATVSGLSLWIWFTLCSEAVRRRKAASKDAGLARIEYLACARTNRKCVPPLPLPLVEHLAVGCCCRC